VLPRPSWKYATLAADYGEVTAFWKRGAALRPDPWTRAVPPHPMTAANATTKSACRSIVLVGLMGVGKSTVGQRLARRLGLPFFDGDAEIERAAGCSIPDIFEFHGEAAFRDGERRVMTRLLDGPPAVIATGGGAYINPEIRQCIRDKAAIAVWLRADVETLVRRVRRAENRPLLRGHDPREVLQRLKTERDPVYAEADITVESDENSAEAVVDRIVAALPPANPCPAS